MRVFVAAGSEYIPQAKRLIKELVEKGHELSYDWPSEIEDFDEDQLAELSLTQVRALRDSEMVIILLPEGSTSNAVLGLALASRSNKRIIIWSPNGREFAMEKNLCAFYFHPAVERHVCSFEELMQTLLGI